MLDTDDADALAVFHMPMNSTPWCLIYLVALQARTPTT